MSIDEFEARAEATRWVDGLVREAQRHRAARHPYLRALAEGAHPDPRWALADFARQYHGYSAHFPRYVTAAVARLEDPAHRHALLANLAEESGVYSEADLAALAGVGVAREWIEDVPHPVLFRRFAEALGVRPGDAPEAEEVRCWRETFLAVIAGGSAAEAIGALGLGTETIVRSVYAFLLEATRRDRTLHPRDTVFFPLHTEVDEAHGATLHAVAVDLAGTPEGRAALRRGMLKALALRASWWDWLNARAWNPATADDDPWSAPVPDARATYPTALEALVRVAASREPLGADAPEGSLVRGSTSTGEALYAHRNERLGIDFGVERLAFPAIQVMDPRVLRIAPGANNEFHKHAHETLFVVLTGRGEVRVGDRWSAVQSGDVAFVPRWIPHQTRNTSASDALVVLAITDFGFTSALLGDYDRRTRLARRGDDAAAG